ncbi:MAG: glycosyltransferase family 4 protein [Armatimonadetes bacterium]|nr:glycosyltransferase family 4 protein [Armatimonadota bacterium]
MRILQVTPVYAPSFSGSAVLFQRLSEGMVERGHEVTVATANALDYRGFWERGIPVNDMPADEIINGVRVKRLPVRRGHSSRNYWRLVHYFWKYRLPGSDWLRTWYDGPILGGVDLLVGGLNPRPTTTDYDLVCAGHTPSMAVVYGHRLARRLNVPYVVIPGLHTDNPFNVDRKNMIRILRSADHLCANTSYERDALVKLCGISDDKISVTGCGVDPARFASADGARFRQTHGIASGTPVVLYVGAEVAHKGLLVLLDAMRSVREAVLVIAGVRSSASDELDRRLLADCQASARVIRLNSFPEESKADMYDACDVFAMPSWSESFGIVYLEAWARSKPVIGCRGAAVETVISDGVDGVLVDPRDVDELASAIRALLADGQMRMRMGKAGRDKVKSTYTWEHVVDRFECVCLGCVNK